MSDSRSAQQTVCLAVGLGWLLAELYDRKRLPGPPPEGAERPLPPHLPGIGAMTPYEKGEPVLGRRPRTLGRAVRQAEHAMWDAEVVAAIGKAATIIPDHDETGPAAAPDHDETGPAAAVGVSAETPASRCAP
jgi:hypothetical protein